MTAVSEFYTPPLVPSSNLIDQIKAGALAVDG
jgi:hypothetical protein